MTWNINSNYKNCFSNISSNMGRKNNAIPNTQNVFQKAASEVALKENKAAVIDHLEHTVIKNSAKLFDMAANTLNHIKEEKGSYGYKDIVNTAAAAYADLYADIEKRYQDTTASYYSADGTRVTKEDEIAWLEQAYETKIVWEQTNARIAAQREKFMGHIAEIPEKEIAQIADDFYAARKQHMDFLANSKRYGTV
ncbi:MAG: hypothetical protein K2N90_06200 [Lachnospiraceae bacterium]|nr:hypothetical protein [Lachnospiraceae bacterium]